MKVRDVMASPAHTCAANDSVAAAAAVMDRHGCRALPVIDDLGRPAGILAERDVFVAVARKTRAPASVLVREVMTADPFTCLPDAEIELVLQVMASCRVRRLPVVDQRGKLVGIVSLADILESMKDTFDFDVPMLRRTVVLLREMRRPRRRVGANTAIPIASGVQPVK